MIFSSNTPPLPPVFVNKYYYSCTYIRFFKQFFRVFSRLSAGRRTESPSESLASQENVALLSGGLFRRAKGIARAYGLFCLSDSSDRRERNSEADRL